MSLDPELVAAYHDCEFTSGSLTRRYRMLRPDLPLGETAPLLLFLHGAGERGDDNQSQLKYLPDHLARPESRKKWPAFVVAPQCRADSTWVDSIWSAAESAPMAESPTEDLRWVMQLLEHLASSEPIDRTRIYLTGLSMGGFGAWELACRLPETFAAVAPICGGGDEHQAHRLVDIPIWAWHGSLDEIVPVVRSRQMVSAIQAAGGLHCRYTELVGEGHHSWVPAYRDESGLLDWLFSHHRRPCPPIQGIQLPC